MRILVVEDNEALARGVENALRDQGYAVDLVSDGEAADQFLRTQGADLALIDVNLPGLSGVDVVRRLRKRGVALPVLILTARTETRDRVEGLDAGADDYLAKPFALDELLARVRALSRRPQAIRPVVERVGRLAYDRGAKQLEGPQGAIELKRRERSLFECLLDRAGRVVSRETLIEQLYGTGAEVDPNAVELSVSRLRRKLDGHGVSIQTVRGLGYMMHPD